MYTTAAVPQSIQQALNRTRTGETALGKPALDVGAEAAIVKGTECLNGAGNVNVTPRRAVLADG